ncbi:MAG: cytochrome c biogenesis heme-transporting ATPase CcmA [Gammaproteobacteria bacterium]|nr:cytochrome c biogenesis heme-transporting ATPase CcmA [Gammaproteobacteria bacterium]
MLTLKKLSAERGDRHLFSNISLELNEGELLHVHGENGSGKTTLLRMLCGLFQPTEGDILWKGQSIHELREEFAENLLYIGHKGGIKDDLSAIENLTIALSLNGTPINEEQASNALARMGLTGFEDLPVKLLSQGQKRRVALAQLLLSAATLWILDEPFVALDKDAVTDLQQIIREHIGNKGMVILTTHQEVTLTRGEVKQLHLGRKVNDNQSF